MHYFIVGLGNVGEEYENTRHNVGFMALDAFSGADGWSESSGTKALYKHMKIGKHAVECLKPTAYMNKSGSAVAYAAKKHKMKPENIIVVHDDLDMPLGKIKIVAGRGSGGHRGVDSIVRALGTKDFVRVRVGVLPTTPTGKLKKPKGDKAVLDFIMKDFRKSEAEALKKTFKNTTAALETIVQEGYAAAANKFN